MCIRDRQREHQAEDEDDMSFVVLSSSQADQGSLLTVKFLLSEFVKISVRYSENAKCPYCYGYCCMIGWLLVTWLNCSQSTDRHTTWYENLPG